MAHRVFGLDRRSSLIDYAYQQWLLQLSLFMGIAWLPVLFSHNTIHTVAALYPLAESAQPYFVLEYAWLLYIWSPLVVLSACLLFLAPGLFLALAFNAGQTISRWLLYGFGLSLVVLSTVTGGVQAFLGKSLRDDAFVMVVVLCALSAWSFLWLRLRQGHRVNWPLHKTYTQFTLVSLLIVPWLLLAALTPKFYWENFNGDGAHAFESSRLLLVQSLPFWDAAAGDIASFPGLTSMLFAFPASWFIRLFGEVEAAVRLPFLLYLVVLYAALLAVIEVGRTARFGVVERGLLWLSLITYTIAVAYSATYSPYTADIALPATQDTLLMVCFLGFTLAFLSAEPRWLALFLGFTFISLPNGLLLIGFWVLALLLFWQPRPWGMIRMTGIAIMGCLVVTALNEPLLTALHLPTPGKEYGALGLLRYFAFLQWAEWRRLAFMVVPCGILPALALLLWWRQDPIARAFTAVSIASFGFFYIQAHIVLHYFIPAMLLPLIVFWRNEAVLQFRPRLLLLTAVGIAGLWAFILSLPRSALPDMNARHIGATIEDRIGGYATSDPAALRRSTLFAHLFPYDWDPTVPFNSYGGSPLVWNYYAHQPRPGQTEINYIVQHSAEPAPPDARLVAEEDDVALYIRSDAIWARQLALRPETPAGSAVYVIPRGIIFRSVPLMDGPTILSMVDVLRALGIDTDVLLDRLGIKE